MGLTIAQGLIFITYITFLLIKFGKPLPSISESWYQLKGLENSLFTWFCWGIGFLMFFQTNGESPFFFISGAGICFVGAATMFKSDDKMTPLIHSVGAITCILAAFLGLWMERGTFLPFLLFGLTAGILNIKSFNISNKTWWVEITAFAFIIIGLLFNPLNHQ